MFLRAMVEKRKVVRKLVFFFFFLVGNLRKGLLCPLEIVTDLVHRLHTISKSGARLGETCLGLLLQV